MTRACAIGFDVGGTKIAAGLVTPDDGRFIARTRQSTSAHRGGEAVLADVGIAIRSLIDEARQRRMTPQAVGIGVAELVGPDGRVLSSATIGWAGVDVAARLQVEFELPALVEADVRAAARAEAKWGAGRDRQSFLYVTVGTGISASLVVNGVPYAGARGLTGTCASSPNLIAGDDGSLASGPPLEQFAAGPAIAARYVAAGGEAGVTSRDVVARFFEGDALAASIVQSAGEALGAAIGQLVNMLDPEIVVIGGGLGLVGGGFRNCIDTAMRRHIWSDLHRDLPLVSAELGEDAGFVGAALAACEL